MDDANQTMEDSLSKKPLVVSLQSGNNLATISVGRETVKLSADEICEFMIRLMNARSQMQPPAIYDSGGSLSGWKASHPTGMRWHFGGLFDTAEGKSMSNVLHVGHPGFGWMQLQFEPEQLQRFLDIVLEHGKFPNQTKQ